MRRPIGAVVALVVGAVVAVVGMGAWLMHVEDGVARRTAAIERATLDAAADAERAQFAADQRGLQEQIAAAASAIERQRQQARLAEETLARQRRAAAARRASVKKIAAVSPAVAPPGGEPPLSGTDLSTY
ncbi:MAG TPA: hypothetical protein VF997_07610 [Polyangia bacterium]